MTLPLILEIAIGLVFIYLILSLLASEIQELITTILQWRAVHLKQSIARLFADSSRIDRIPQRFADQLYQTPIVRSLNHEATGRIETLLRQFGRLISTVLSRITNATDIFGSESSGPSYIPPQSFASAIIQKLNIRELGQRYSELLLRNSIEQKLVQTETILADLRHSVANDALFDQEFAQLKQTLNHITHEFHQQRRSLSAVAAESTDRLLDFIDAIDQQLVDDHHCKDIVRDRLPHLRQSVSWTVSSPTVSEVIHILTDADNYDQLPQELLELVVSALSLDDPPPAHSLHELLKAIRRDRANLPPQLQRSLQDIAQLAQDKVDDLETGLQEFEKEVAIWFDRSMERARGVYTRNAKGIALVIGIAIAVATNADTFHIVSRLSRDSALRATIQNAATQVAPPPVALDAAATEPDQSEAERLEDLKAAVETALEDLPLPIGRSPINVAQQEAASQNWPIPILRRILGWIITGVAISMGASFWYDLLKRVVRVRNTGKEPD
jgi:hypothetical protein